MVARRQHLDVGRAKAWRDQVAIAHKLKWIGHSQKRSEGQANDTVRFFEFSPFEQADFDGVLCGHCFTSPRRGSQFGQGRRLTRKDPAESRTLKRKRE